MLIKEHITFPFDDVLRRVSQLAFSSAKCANPNDHFFTFRIKSNRKDIYPQMASAITEFCRPSYGCTIVLRKKNG